MTHWKQILITSADRAIMVGLTLVTAKAALTEVDWPVVGSTVAMAFLMSIREQYQPSTSPI